jgi:hypothetical protein
MIVPGKSDAQKSIRLTREEPQEHIVYYVESPSLKNSKVKTVPTAAWKSAIRQVWLLFTIEEGRTHRQKGSHGLIFQARAVYARQRRGIVPRCLSFRSLDVQQLYSCSSSSVRRT